MKSERRKFLRVFFRRKITYAAAFMLIVFIACAMFSPLLATHNPDKQDLRNTLASPSAQHWLGTDQYGRDIYSRLVYGARMAFVIGVLSVLVASVVGTLIGLASGYFGGAIDAVLMRFVEAQMSIPMVMLALALVAVFGNSVALLSILLGVSSMPGYARMMRAQVLSVRELDYVAASKIIGNSNIRTMIKHIFPNCLSPLIIIMSGSIGSAVLAESALSYLGVGINPPLSSWGKMVSDGYSYLSRAPVFALSPGIIIILLVLSFNIIGDALRDALDPRLRGEL